MWVQHRHLLAALVVLAMLATTSGAGAWIETAIRSDTVVVDLERDGSATVSHQMLMNIRGGPLRSYQLDGIDSDAELLSDATVSRARSGAAVTPIPLLLHRGDDGTLRLEIDQKRGLLRGTYLFAFRYRTDLIERGLIQSEDERASVSWIGPRFADGIDSAQVVFRVPPAQHPPRLPPVDAEQLQLGLAEDPGGVFLSTLRRSHDKDELEVVRPHIARGEPVVWTIQADAHAFDALAAAAEPAVGTAPAPGSVPHDPRQRAVLIAAALGIAFGYALLVVLKARLFALSCRVRRAQLRALLPLPTPLRGAVAGAALAAAAGVAVYGEQPTPAGALLVVAMVFAALRSPKACSPMRGPGEWKAISDDEAFRRRGPRPPGRWLDTGAVPGFVVFVLALAAVAYGAIRVFPASPYYALLLALASASLIPIFCTGRGSELPPDPVDRPRALLAYLAKRVRRSSGLQAKAWARFPRGGSEPDELRLLVVPGRALSGLTGIEVGLEYQFGGGGPLALPYVLARTQDGSAAYSALATDVAFMRGRRSGERVAVIRPKLPTRAMALRLTLRIADLLTDKQGQSKKARPARRPVARAA